MKIVIGNASHIQFAKTISQCIDESAKDRGTGIARRTPEYIIKKLQNGNAVIALDGDQFAGFCYIEIWQHGKYVAHSGLIVSPQYRGKGLAKAIKKKVFELSLEKYPGAKIFGITTGQAVMKINYELVLTRTDRSMCLCTGMLHDPNDKNKTKSKTTAFLSGLFKKKSK